MRKDGYGHYKFRTAPLTRHDKFGYHFNTREPEAHLSLTELIIGFDPYLIKKVL